MRVPLRASHEAESQRTGLHTGGWGGWRKRGLLATVAAVALLSLTLTACTPSLTLPVTLASTPVNGITVPAEIRHGAEGSTLVVVEVLIQGKGPYPMAIDTGASLTLIDSSLATQLGLPAAGSAENITGVGGGERVTPVSITQWSLGQAQLPAMTITSSSLSDLRRSAGVDGLLGSDLFARFGAVTINYADSQVTLYQTNTSSGGSSSSRWSRGAVA